MTLKQIIMWYTLHGDVNAHSCFMDNHSRKSKLYYFQATVGNKTIRMNYRKYGDRFVLYDGSGGASVEFDVYTDACRSVRCYTVKELNEAINDDIQ